MKGPERLREILVQPEHDQEAGDQRQDVLEVEPQRRGDLQSLAGIDFLQVVFKAPAVLRSTEQGDQEGTDGQHQVADIEVLQIHDAVSCLQRFDEAQHVEAQGAGNRTHGNDDAVHQRRFLPVRAAKIHREADDVLEDADHRGKRRKEQEHKEQASPEPSLGHVVEDLRDGDEDQSGAAVRGDPVGKAGRENDKACHDGHEGVQRRHEDCLARKTLVLPDIASEDLHAAHAEAQSKEALGQRRIYHVPDTLVPKIVRIRHQIEFQALRSAGKHHAVDSQHHHQDDECRHHDLRDPLNAVLQSRRADHHRDHHDDQHGTAIVVLAGIINALKVVKKKKEDCRIVVNGAGSAGVAITKLLLRYGFPKITMCDKSGILSKNSSDLNWMQKKMMEVTNLDGQTGSLADALKGADIFVGVSAPNIVTPEMVQSMNQDAILFAMANPTPEIMPDVAKAAGARVVGTGRSDFPNQVNNVVAFPGIFKGALEAHAKDITEEMKLAAAEAIASLVPEDELNDENIMPEAFDPKVSDVVAQAVKDHVKA